MSILFRGAVVLGLMLSPVWAMTQETKTANPDPASIQFDSLSKPFAPPPKIEQAPAAPIQSGLLKPMEVPSEPPKVPVIDRDSLSGSLQIRVDYPDSIILNQSAKVRIHIQNPTGRDVTEARLVLSLPGHVQFVDATLKPVKLDENLFEFKLKNLAARGTTEVSIDVIPVDKKPITFDTELQIINRERVEIQVQQPVLEVSVSGPERLVLGERTPFQLAITNIGDGPARHIRLISNPSEGVELDANADLSELELASGKSHSMQVFATATRSGPNHLQIELSADAADAAASNVDFVVIKPELSVEVLGPQVGFVGQTGVYGVKLTNPSDIDLENVSLSLQVPPEAKIQTVSHECEMDATGQVLTWKLPKLSAGVAAEFKWISRAEAIGEIEYGIHVASNHTQAKTLVLPVKVDSRPDLTLSIRNLVDPVPAGEASEYVMVVENHGSKAANDVLIKVDLPRSWLAISQDGNRLAAPATELNYNVGLLPAGEKRELRFQAGSNEPGEYIVRATVQIPGSDLRLAAEDSALVFQPKSARVSETLGPPKR